MPSPMGVGRLEPQPVICHDLRAWSVEHPGTTYQVLTPASAITRRLPQTIEVEVDASFAPLANVAVPERALVGIAGGRVTGGNGLVVLPDDNFVGELVAMTPACQRAMLSQEAAFAAPRLQPARRLAGAYSALTVIGWPNYYHWLHDVILRLHSVLPQLSSDARFMVPQGLRPFHYASLALIGVDQARLELFPGQETWAVERLYVSTPIHKTQINSALCSAGPGRPAYSDWVPARARRPLPFDQSGRRARQPGSLWL